MIQLHKKSCYLALVRKLNQTEITGMTHASKSASIPKTSVAAGSAAQLERVEAEVKQESSTDKPEVKPMPQNKLKVNIYPFAVCIRRLTQKEIEKYTKRPQESRVEKHKLPPHSPVTTRSMTKKKINKGQKCRTITGHPSQLASQQKPTFTVRRHILRRCKHKTYLKCREHGCTMAYVTFNTVKDLNTHH